MALHPRLSALVRTKLNRPHGFVDLVERPQLLARLDQALTVPLTLISAPAGFGKTTLIGQWLDYLERADGSPPRVAWLSVGEQESDLAVFLSYFIAALRNIFPDACPKTLDMLDVLPQPTEEMLAAMLVNEIEALGRDASGAITPFIIVLDDYDAIHGEVVDNLVGELLRFPPPAMHLIITSRRDPVLPISRLRARRQLVEIRSRDLRLDPREVSAFVERQLPARLTAAEVSVLADETEGWVTALHLAILYLHDAPQPGQAVVDLQGSPRYVMDYLLDEVLARQPSALQECLLETSILDRFCAPLCEAVCVEAAGRGAEFIARLEAFNLFLVGLDSAGVWYRYHHLFQQLLRRQLAQRYPEAEIAALHRQAATWFASQDLIEESLRHSLAAGDIDGALALIAYHRNDTMNREQWQRLDRWLRMFPPDAEEHVEWLLAEAFLTWSRRADILRVAALADRAEASLTRATLPPDRCRALEGELAALRSMVAYHALGDPEAAVAYGQSALDTLPLAAYLPRTLTYVHVAGGLFVLGDSEAAYALMAAGAREEALARAPSRLRIVTSINFLRWMDGSLDAVLTSATQLQLALDGSSRRESVGWGHYFAACVHYQRHDLAAAEREARQVVEDPLAGSSAIATAHAAAVLAFTDQAQGWSQKARTTVETLLALARRNRNQSLVPMFEALEADLAVRRGDLALAHQWAASLQTPPPLRPSPLFYVPQLTLPRLLVAQNTPASRQQAGELLAELRQYVTTTHNRHVLIETLALQAALLDADGNTALALATLTEALTLAEPGGLVRVFVDAGPRLAALLPRVPRGVVAPDYLDQILRAYALPSAALAVAPSGELIERLTEREIDVLLLLSQRQSNKEIAHALVLSPATVKRHTINIYQKLHVNSRREAVAKASALGILPPL